MRGYLARPLALRVNKCILSHSGKIAYCQALSLCFQCPGVCEVLPRNLKVVLTKSSVEAVYKSIGLLLSILVDTNPGLTESISISGYSTAIALDKKSLN